MGLLSSSLSITRYRVNGSVKKPILDVLREGLSTNAISEIDSGISIKRAGWTSIETPYKPDFSGSSFVYGPYFISSKHSRIESNPDFDPRRENQGVQICAGIRKH